MTADHDLVTRRQTVSVRDAAQGGLHVSEIPLLPARSRPRPAPAFTYGPVTEDALRHFHNDQFEPPVSVFIMRRVEVVGPWFSCGALLLRGEIDFLLDGIALNPEDQESRRRLLAHLHATANGEKTVRRVAGAVMLLANNGHQIYGHWLVDFLPKLCLLELAGIDLDRITVLLPSNMEGFGGALLRLLGIPEQRILRYDPDHETIVPDELVVPTTLRWGGRCSPLFADGAAFLNERIDRFSPVPAATRRKLFLSRPRGTHDGRPLLNQDAIEAIASAHGFEVVHPERLPLPEQIALIRGARRVVGQYGSALHGTLFGRPGCVVAGLHGQLPATFDALQSGIGERLGQPTGYVFATPSSMQENPWAVSVDAEDLARCLREEF